MNWEKRFVTGDDGKPMANVALYVCKSKEDEPFSIVYEFDNKLFKKVECNFDFTGSDGLKITTPAGGVSSSLQIKGVVEPFSRARICEINAVNEDAGFAMRISMGFEFTQPDQKHVTQLINTNKDELAQLIKSQPPIDPKADAKSINKTMASHNKSFIDVTFPPTTVSLYGPPNRLIQMTNQNSKDEPATWRRANQFMKDPKIFRDGIEPTDIKQGLLGDCWFLCALSSLAEFPKLIDRLFVTKTYDANGASEMRICKNGLWTNVVVDDYFPCFPDAGPLYSRGDGDELWVLYLEKAYAKLHGAYDGISGGIPLEALCDLTGAPIVTYDFHDSETDKMIKNGKLFELMCAWDKRNYCITASTPGVDDYTSKGKKPSKTNPGIVPGHAYSVISCLQVKGYHLVRLRNPWGNFEWTGKFSDNDKESWTPEMMSLCNVTQADLNNDHDGLFFMLFEDFLSYFTRVSVCMVRHGEDEPWFEARLPTKLFKHHFGLPACSHFFDFKVPGATDGYLSLHQQDNRVIGHEGKPYLCTGFLLLDTATDEIVMQSEPSIARQHISYINVQKKGDYIIMPFVDSTFSEDVRDVAFSAHLDVLDADNDVKFATIPFSESLFDRFVIAAAMKLPKKHSSPDFSTRSGFLFGTIWCFLVTDVAPGTEVDFELEFPNADNMRSIDDSVVKDVKKTAYPGKKNLITVLARKDFTNISCGTGQMAWGHTIRKTK